MSQTTPAQNQTGNSATMNQTGNAPSQNYSIHSLDSDLIEKHIVAGCSDGLVRIFSVDTSHSSNSISHSGNSINQGNSSINQGNSSNNQPPFSSNNQSLSPIHSQPLSPIHSQPLSPIHSQSPDFPLISELSGHTSPVVKALFVNYGEIIISADFSGKLILWKLENGTFVKRVDKQILEGAINDISVRHSESENKIVVFCACDKGMLYTVTIDGNNVNVSNNVNSNSNNVNSNSNNVNSNTFTNSNTFSVTSEQRHNFGITSVSSNGSHLVTGGMDAKVIKDNKEQVTVHEGIVTSVSIAPDNCLEKTIIASCSEDGKVMISEEREGNYERKCIDLKKPCYEVKWTQTGFILIVRYGENEIKSFMRGKEGEYEEVDLVQY